MRSFLLAACVMLVLAGGYTSGLSAHDSVEPPPYSADRRLAVVARVDGFDDLGAFVDHEQGFSQYHTMRLVVEQPEPVAWTMLRVQYQRLPIVEGRRIELGDRLRFIAPPPASNGCCGPYLEELKGLTIESGMSAAGR